MSPHRSLQLSLLLLALIGLTCTVITGCAAEEDAAYSRTGVDIPEEDWEISNLESIDEAGSGTGEEAAVEIVDVAPEPTPIPSATRLAPPEDVPTASLPSPKSPRSSFPKNALPAPETAARSRTAVPMTIAPPTELSPGPGSDTTRFVADSGTIPRTVEPRVAETPSEAMAFEMGVEAAPSPETAVDEVAVDRTPVAEDRGDYEAVTVFYGTDRSSTATSGLPAEPHRLWLYSAGVCVLLFGLFTAVALLSSRKKTFASLAVLSFSAGGVLAIMGTIAWLQSDGAIAGPKLEYGNGRGQFVMGTCEVSIPPDHQVAELEAPSIFKLDFVKNPTKHVVLMDIEEKDSDAFFSELRNRVELGTSKDAFVFVHGFNVTFEDAARRTAQLAYDLKFQGAPIFYSWPSQGGLFQYAVDETNVVWTVPHLREFLKEIAAQSGAQSIHLIAHSMGNRALTSALRELSLEMQGVPPLFHEVVLTAPDIDAEIFRRDIAPAIVSTAKRVTLYASSNDEALVLSKQVHGYPRAGDTGDGLVVIPGIDTIDVSAVDTSLLGHNYYGDNATVISDMIDLVRNSKSADQRSWLEMARLDNLLYWVFRVDRGTAGTARSDSPTRY